VDLTIVGAGIAGLWLRAVLHHAGFRVLLMERDCLGGEQTLASQGIVHGGLKYALGAALTRASEAAAAMPSRWRRLCREGGVPDLRAVPMLSDCVHLFADAGLEGRLVSFFASRALQGRVERLPPSGLPHWLQGPRGDGTGFRGQAYRLDDFVLDVEALIDVLAAADAGPVVHGELTAITQGNAALGLDLRPGRETAGPASTLHVDSQRLLLCAGAGNEALLALAGQDAPAMQRRPLHQAWAHAASLPAVYAHCITGTRSAEPRLTITTRRTPTGTCWSLGGAIATQGTHRDAAAQAEFARAELAACLPWLDLPPLRIETRMVDRAEPRTDGGNRPDHAFLHQHAGILTCWPTKLTLAPDLGDRVLAALAADGLRPRADADDDALRRLRPPSRPADDATEAHA
jgi:glycine/D-amino acid oxidase-like deaminating enzyme